MLVKKVILLSIGVATVIMTGCGGATNPSKKSNSKFGTGFYIDSAVSGIHYKCGVKEGNTGSNGEFTFEKGESCTFSFAGIKLREVVADLLKDEVVIIEDDIKVATFLQTLDKDGDPTNGITIPAEIITAMSEANIDALPQNANDIKKLYIAIKDVPQYKGKEKSTKEADEHLQGTIKDEAEKSDDMVAFSLPLSLYKPDIDKYNNGFDLESKTLSFLKNKNFTYSESELKDGIFVVEENDSDDNDFELKNGQWIQESDEDTTPFTLSSDRKKVTLTNWNTELYQQSVVDISGRNIILDGTNEIVTMPNGAKKIMLKIMRKADTYYVWESENYTTLADVVKNRCGTNYFTHAKDDSGINGIAFTCGQEGSTSGTLVGVKSDNSLVPNIGTWEIKTLQDSDVSGLLITVKHQYNEDSDNQMYAIKDGKVWRGQWEKTGVSVETWYNRAAMGAFETKMKKMAEDDTGSSGASGDNPIEKPNATINITEEMLNGKTFYYSFHLPIIGGVFYGKKSFSSGKKVSGHKIIIGTDKVEKLNVTYTDKPYTLVGGKQQVVGSTENLQFTLTGILEDRWLIAKEIDSDRDGMYERGTNTVWYFNKPDGYPNGLDVSVVADTIKPIISIKGEPSITLTVGDTYTDAGATASDNKDGDITANIVKTGTVDTATAKTYTIKYNVKDVAGNSADEVVRTVVVNAAIVADTVKPIIVLKGESSITLTVGDTYTDAGATASDNKDGDITNSIVKTGTVDTTTAKTYTIKYNVHDAAGNNAPEVVRTVIVKAPVNPYSSYNIAKDNTVNEVVKTFNGYTIKVLTDHQLGDNPSNDTIAVYGLINDSNTGALLKINANYPTGTKIVIQAFSSDGTLAGTSELKTTDGTNPVNFGSFTAE